jgi:hypothetical protein
MRGLPIKGGQFNGFPQKSSTTPGPPRDMQTIAGMEPVSEKTEYCWRKKAIIRMVRGMNQYVAQFPGNWIKKLGNGASISSPLRK